MCTMHQVDIQKSEAFAERMIGMMNQGALSLLTSIGHRTGLFDTMKELPPSTSNQIAHAAGLNERYVREWLGGMTVGRIVECHVNGSNVNENLDHPIAPFLYTASTMHCMTVSLAYGGLGLGTMWGKEKVLEMLGEAGFKNVEVEQLEHDFQNYYYMVRKS
jgi:hypothetical protein